MSNNIRSLLCLVFLLCPAVTARADEEQEMADALMSQIVELASVSLETQNRRKSAAPPLASCRALAWLYKNPHPLNPYHQDTRARDAAIAACDLMADRDFRGTGGFRYHGEWHFYNLCQVYELLKEELPSSSKKLWREYADFYMSTRGRRPMYYTSFNHEAGNVFAVLRAGQVFGVPEWEQRAGRLMRQLIQIQQDLGYFDEGPHHGPSMTYNQIQLSTMLLYYDYSQDEAVLAACEKLADFMIRYSMPDGSTAGCLDGRQNWTLGFSNRICYGLDRWPKGKRLNRLIYRSLKKWGILEPGSKYAAFWDGNFFWRGWFLVDEYLSLRPQAPVEPLPQERNGYLMAETGPTFNGGIARNHDWVVALSAINSDIPRISKSIYRAERQSRLDIWHQKTGLIIGGGHNLRDTDLPMANFHLLTGYAGIDCRFGKLSGEDFYDKRAVYLPRNVKADITLERQILHEVFGQGDLGFTVTPLDNRRLKVRFSYDVFSAKKILVQLPLILFYDSRVTVDGSPFSGDKLTIVKNNVTVSNPTMDSTVRITVPEEYVCALRPPVFPERSYDDLAPGQHYEPYYKISLLSLEIRSPVDSGSGEFLLEILD